MIEEFLKAKGRVVIETRDSVTGELKDRREFDNLVVDVGKAFIASRMVGTPAAMSHMAVGTSATAPAANNTALGAELARAALASSTSAGAVITYQAQFAAGVGTGALTEAGLFNASSAGTMLARVAFATVNKGANDVTTITWTVTIS